MARLETAAGSRRAAWAVPFVLAVLTLLVSPDLMPAYSEINPFDEAKYIESGRLLLRGELRELVWGPIVAFVYAPLHLIFGASPDWFVLEARAGRILMFASLWLATYHLALQFRPMVRRSVTIGVLFISTSFFVVLKNPSDAVFAVFSALSLSRLIAFHHHRREGDIWLGSALLALSILSRFEAIILFPFYVLAAVLWGRPTISIPRILLSALLPATVILAGYILAFQATSPGLGLGIAGKSYASFEANQPIAGTDSYEERTNERQALARELFGTAQDNRGSVLRAMMRNPVAFAERIVANMLRIPDFYLETFGKRLGPAFLLVGLWGTLSLLRTPDAGPAIVLAMWMLQPFVSLVFLPTHSVRQMSHLILIISSIGVTSMISGGKSTVATSVPLACALLLASYGLLDAKLAFLVAGLVMASALALISLTEHSEDSRSVKEVRGAAMLLAAGLILRGGYPFPDYSPMGTSPEEQVVHYLQAVLPRESRVLESLPLPAVAAGMAQVSWGHTARSLSTPEELQAWLISQEIDAVFVDSRDIPSPGLVDLLAAGPSPHFRMGYESEDRRLRVFLVQAEGSE